MKTETYAQQIIHQVIIIAKHTVLWGYVPDWKTAWSHSQCWIRMSYFIAQSPVMHQKCNHSDNNFPWEQWGCENGAHVNVMLLLLGFPGGSDSKESTCDVGDLGSIPRLGRSLGGVHDNLFQYSSLENPHGERYPTGCSPGGPKEQDTTEWLSTAQRAVGIYHWWIVSFLEWGKWRISLKVNGHIFGTVQVNDSFSSRNWKSSWSNFAQCQKWLGARSGH